MADNQKKSINAKSIINTLVLAIVAGLAIGVGGCTFLTLKSDNNLLGTFMFTAGLCTICFHGLNLFTGKMGYVVNEKPAYILDLVIIWIGNFIGTYLMAECVLHTRVAGNFEVAKAMCETKMNDSYSSLFILGIFCGFLMFVAVDGYKSTKNAVILFMCVAAFIFCGFEHCIADMFYFSIARAWNVEALVRVIIITFGNVLGGILIPLARKLNPNKAA